jgi:hypothetical protein
MQVTPSITLSATRNAGQRAVPGRDARPGPSPGHVHCGADPAQLPLPAAGDLIQRPPRGRHRRDQLEQILLIAHHPEAAHHLGAVRDRAGQADQHPAPVMDQQPAPGQRLRQPRSQASAVPQRPDQELDGQTRIIGPRRPGAA